MPRGYQFKRRRTSRRGYKRGGNKGFKGQYKRYGDVSSSRSIRSYLKSPGIVRIKSSMGAFPPGVETTLTYCETVSITTTSGVNDFYVWSGNSLFDPNVTGGGSQPFGLDQWGAIYNRYLVYGSQCTLEVCLSTTPSTAEQYTFKLTLVPFAQTTGLSSLGEDVVAEMPFAKTKTCNVYSEGTGNKLTSYASTAKVFGVPNAYVDLDDSFSALFTANPTRAWAWWVKVNSMSDDQSVTYKVRIRIKYYAKLYQNTLDTGS